ncbi:guanylate kinase [Parasediminibacterium sp. JCM 36343]|uniref:guanylate kinase n=1 Tax=Parasediminibacterium sp. JCM 36343 TaxID=3374279 RepID=UPI0039781958
MDNKIIIITAPSGAGKTSITRYLLQHYPVLAFSISATTRKKRGQEVDGQDYYFLELEDFNQKITEQAFIEWEMVYQGTFYGTLKTELDRIWGDGKVPMLDIDVKGAIHVQQQYPNQSLSIFIEPPSVDALKIRLASRGTETEESLQTRVNKAAYEISFKHHFNKIILNDELQKACLETEDVVKAFLEA